MPASPRETLLCRYSYDSLDRTIAWTPDKQASLQRFYCKSRLATEIQAATRYCFFQHDNHVQAQQRHMGTTVDTTLLATDQQHSVLNALNATQPNPLAYSPYGHRPQGNGLLSRLGFNGERPDPVTGHYHLGNGYRQFNPVLMRFNSPDSWSPFGRGGLNAYAYCLGDPVNQSDPNGHGTLYTRVSWGSRRSVVSSTQSLATVTPQQSNRPREPSRIRSLARLLVNRVQHAIQGPSLIKRINEGNNRSLYWELYDKRRTDYRMQLFRPREAHPLSSSSSSTESLTVPFSASSAPTPSAPSSYPRQPATNPFFVPEYDQQPATNPFFVSEYNQPPATNPDLPPSLSRAQSLSEILASAPSLSGLSPLPSPNTVRPDSLSMRGEKVRLGA